MVRRESAPGLVRTRSRSVREGGPVRWRAGSRSDPPTGLAGPGAQVAFQLGSLEKLRSRATGRPPGEEPRPIFEAILRRDVGESARRRDCRGTTASDPSSSSRRSIDKRHRPVVVSDHVGEVGPCEAYGPGEHWVPRANPWRARLLVIAKWLRGCVSSCRCPTG